MPGTNAGTGHPITLRCSKCRQQRIDRSRGYDLTATGRSKSMPTRGVRQMLRKIEYRCRSCGHVGWTTHSDAERIFQAAIRAQIDAVESI
jgi:hypothetical protein